MITSLLEFVLSASVIITAGIFITKSADRIANITGFGGLLVGSIFLAAATSLPELMVNISAVSQNNPDLAIGNVLGSNLFNLLILAICDLLYRSHSRMFTHTAVTHALSATQSTALVALGGLGILLAPRLTEFAVGPIGLCSLAILGAYLLGLRLVVHNQRVDSPRKQNSKSHPRHRYELGKSLLAYLSSAAIILLAAPFVSKSATTLAEQTGLGNTFIGTTLLALCTSLPELVASLSAVKLGAYDLALGNIFGSNAFNMLLIVPLDFISTGPLLALVSPTHLITCLATIVITAVAVMGQLYQVEERKFLVEPDAALVIILVFGALSTVYFLR